MGTRSLAKIAGVEITAGSPVAFLLLVSFLYVPTCTAGDGAILTANDTIKDGETLVSDGEDFAFGFFSPQNSTKRYAGIWYNKIRPETVVWVANRDTPLANSTGMIITIDANGNLVIMDGSKDRILWSTNISTAAAKVAHAELMNTGNLILREIDNSDNTTRRDLWESFNTSSDTYLPNMKHYSDPKWNRSHPRMKTTSWRSPSDPSMGNFSIAVDPQDLPQVLIWDGDDVRWRSGPWNGRVFLGIPRMDSSYLNGLSLIKIPEGLMEISYVYFNDTSYNRYLLDSMGGLKQMRWEGEKNQWSTIWSTPDTICDLYNRCGPFGRCSMASSPVCNCFQGFEPKYVEEWSRGNWSGGCKRSKQLECEKNINIGINGTSSTGMVEEEARDGFLKMERIKVPDFAVSLAGGSLEECEKNCKKNCSCVAYAYDSWIGCMSWKGDLLDIQQFSTGGIDFYLRLPASELAGKKSKVKIVIISTALAATFILMGCIYLFRRWKAKHKEGNEHFNGKQNEMLHCNDSSEISNPLTDGVKGTAARELPLIGLNQVAIATNNFSDENKLGEGGFGPVYKGWLPGGQQIAVKRLSKSSGQGLEEFKNEAVLISRVQHRNLVRLLGCCTEGEEKILIYEYMPKKSLDNFLFGSSKTELLDWGKRFHIIEGIARGLLYLHRDSRFKIIHRDLKASNILLDEGLNPKISDFGMARILGEEQILAKTTRVVGTYGYMSPEYAMDGRFSEKSDVFSFGVLLLEIVTGKRNASFYHDEHASNLLCHAWQLWNESKVLELMDPEMVGSYPEEQVLRCIHLGFLCVQEFAKDRPSMASVVFMLGCDTVTLPAPKHPAFTERSPLESDPSQRNHENCSSSDATITDTIFEGR